MNTSFNAAPYADLQGIQDVSGRPPVIEPESLPTHLPHIFVYAQKGPTEPQLVSGDSLSSIFGDATLDTRSPYFNHQSVLANLLQGDANALMLQRVLPTDIGPKARLLISLDYVADQIQLYERNADGSYARDQNGNKIPLTGSNSTAPGYKAKWVVNTWLTGTNAEAFGQCQKRVGSLVSSTSAQSQIVPVMELEVYWFGSYGNGIGVRFTAPTTLSSNPANDALVEAIQSYMYRLQIFQRPDATTLPTTVKNLNGEDYVEFSFNPNAYDAIGADASVAIGDVLLPSYSNTDEPGTPPTYGPFGQLHVYQDNLLSILEAVGTAELPFGLLGEGQTTITADSPNLHMVNPFGATDITGVPYYTLALIGPEDNGVFWNDISTQFAAGGTDGTMSDALFDQLVKTQVTNYGSGDWPLLDDARYPQSCIYDTGFPLATKLAMIPVLGKRKDMYVVLSTQDISLPQNTAAVESSIAVSLKTAARNYPESAILGTSVCRAVVIGNSGYLLNSKYKKLLPLTLEFAHKCAIWQGSGDGTWKPGLGYDTPNNNRLTLFRGVNVTFKEATVRNKDWANGLVWAQTYDRRSNFWPAVQTVYDDDSSILNSAVNMQIAVELEKVAQRTWRDLTGVGGLTADQFIERSNQLIDERTTGRFDNRATIVAETYYTAGDVQRGYSWACKIHMYGANMKTVGTYTIVAHRQSDLNQAAA